MAQDAIIQPKLNLDVIQQKPNLAVIHTITVDVLQLNKFNRRCNTIEYKLRCNTPKLNQTVMQYWQSNNVNTIRQLVM